MKTCSSIRLLMLAVVLLVVAVAFVAAAVETGRDIDRPKATTVTKADDARAPDQQVITPKSTPQRGAIVEPVKPVQQHAVPLPQTGQTTLPSPGAPATGEQINWQVISSGGTDGSSTSFQLAGTVGQTATGFGSSANFGLSHGFWQESGAGDCCGIYTGGYTGNCNCDTEGKRNLADITQLISRVYLTPGVPLCCEENGNTNGDPGGVINLADITGLIDHVYVSGAETAPCP
jgi:hypothetical protein